MKRIIACIISAVMLISFAACSKIKKPDEDNGKMNIICTVFPIYDWAKQIAGEDNFNLKLLLDSGIDLHSYQPTADDIMKISSCDIFIYVGGESDKWVADVLKNAQNENMIVINLLEVIGSMAKTEEHIDGMETEEGEEDEDEYDEHIWLSLKNAQVCVKEISKRVIEKDEANRDVYEKNTEEYLKKLGELDEKFEKAAKNKKTDTVLFADRYPFRYLFDDYGINAYAAFSGCSAESEASFRTVSFLATKINELGLKVVLTTESSDGKLAETVINSTYDKNMKILTMDSLQSKTSNDIAKGTTYLSVMEKNLEVFTQAIA